MIQETIEKLEKAIRLAAATDPAHRDELIRLLEQLKAEVHSLPPADHEAARSIAQFAEAATHEASRSEKSARLLELSRSGLEESVAGFEGSHPQLVGVVNRICNLLAGIGI